MKYLFVLIFIIVYIINPPLEIWGFSSYCPLSKGTSEAEGFWIGIIPHLTYMFLHAGIIHLLINSFSFVSAWIIMKRFYRKGYFYVVPFALAFLTSFIPLCIFDKPTVGVSGVVYAMIGMILPYFNFKKTYLFYLSIALSLIVSFFIHSSNFYLHLFCFIGGVLFTVFYKYFTIPVSPFRGLGGHFRKTSGGGKPIKQNG